MSGPGEARLHDRGYRRYEGPRGGVPNAMRSVGVQSVRRALGLRRSVWAKLPPWLIIGLAFVPAMVFVGIGVLLPDAQDAVPDFADYYGYVGVILLLFVAWTAPEILSSDRRAGMLGLYMASPLSRGTYLLAKSVAIGTTLLAITLGPVAFLLIARILAGTGPAVADVPLLVLRILVSALVLSAIYGLLGALVAAFADRRPVATVGTILVALVLAAAAGVMVDTAEYPPWLLVFDITEVASDALNVIWNVDEPRTSELPTIGVVAAVAGWIAVPAIAIWARYRALEVTR